MKHPRTGRYDTTFVAKHLMGPNCMMMLEELTNNLPLKEGMLVLDLGCGRGLTSIFLAKEFGGQVFATDLWIPATVNYQTFHQQGLENQIIPIHANALDLPYADE
jgi:cyclopropane fatty-acyl-phospholipid synthase-like methyltransferase